MPSLGAMRSSSPGIAICFIEHPECVYYYRSLHPLQPVHIYKRGGPGVFKLEWQPIDIDVFRHGHHEGVLDDGFECQAFGPVTGGECLFQCAAVLEYTGAKNIVAEGTNRLFRGKIGTLCSHPVESGDPVSRSVVEKTQSILASMVLYVRLSIPFITTKK